MSLLQARGVTVTARAAGQSVEVLRDIDFEIAEGTTLGVVGESGAGKSMIGRLIAQMLPPGFAVAEGSLQFQGRELVGLGARRRNALLGKDIAFIPQHPLTSLNPVRTVGSQFDEHLRRLGVRGRAERRAVAIRNLADVQLPNPEGLLRRYPHQLSGGMCQRVLIAMAFAGEPPLLIADEPTTALDVITQARIMQLIAAMREKHKTSVMFVTHDLRLAAQVCDEIMVMYAGEIVERGPAREVFGNPRHPYTHSLQQCNPTLSGPRRQLISLPDHMPGLSAFAGLPGCRFAPRCPVGDGACSAARPAMAEVAPGHWVRASQGCVAGTSAIVAPPAEVRAVAAGEHLRPILEVQGVSKVFQVREPGLGLSHRRIEAVKDVSLTVYPGEFVGIVGESGSGKSTFAKLLMGLETPTEGKILIEENDMTGPFGANAAARIEQIQMVFQDPASALNPRRRISRLVTQAMEGRNQNVPWPERLERAKQLLRDTGLAPDTIERYPSQLSGGQRQRVNIARALCATPKILVADEIVSGLDVSVQAQILNLLLDLRESRSVSLVFISHDLSVVRYLCPRVMVMYRGEVVEAGDTETIFTSPQHDYTKALIAAVPPDDPQTDWRVSDRVFAFDDVVAAE